jgi:hypothetical protein
MLDPLHPTPTMPRTFKYSSTGVHFMKNKKQSKAPSSIKPGVKVKDIAPKKSPKGGAITRAGDGYV